LPNGEVTRPPREPFTMTWGLVERIDLDDSGRERAGRSHCGRQIHPVAF
jgi:hypothetical protein